MEQAWSHIGLTVQVATKLNRSHLFPGAHAYLLPCLGRLEVHEQQSGPGRHDRGFNLMHLRFERSCEAHRLHLLSEPKIVAEIAKASLPRNEKVPWDNWVADYGKVRDAIERSYPNIFSALNKRMWTPGSFEKRLAARKRVWKTDTRKANFKVPKALSASFDTGQREDVLRPITL
jgi:hypothetical protein